MISRCPSLKRAMRPGKSAAKRSSRDESGNCVRLRPSIWDGQPGKADCSFVSSDRIGAKGATAASRQQTMKRTEERISKGFYFSVQHFSVLSFINRKMLDRKISFPEKLRISDALRH